MPANVIRLASNSGLVAGIGNPVLDPILERQHQGCESHGTVMLGNLRAGRVTSRFQGFGIFHGDHPPIYNLTLSRPETLEPWLQYCNVNFLGTPLPMVYPGGVIKLGIPSLGGLTDLQLPTIGLPSIPWPNINLSWLADLQLALNLQNLFEALHLPLPLEFQVNLAAFLQELIEKIRKALPDFSLPLEWFMGLLFKFGLGLMDFLGRLAALPAFVWRILVTLPLDLLRFGPLPDLPGVDMEALRAVLDLLLAAFTNFLGAIENGFRVILRWLASVADGLASIIAALLGVLSAPFTFTFPGIDFGQIPPAGTPWPPFPPTAVCPLVTWPEWMRPPVIANVPLALPPGTSMAAGTTGTFAYTSLPGFFYQAFFDLRIPDDVPPGVYQQEFFLSGTTNPSGTPIEKLGRITLVCQLLEPELAPGFRPFGNVTYELPPGAGPMMTREEQYANAPQADFESEHDCSLTYTSGQEVYHLPDAQVASRITAVQVCGSTFKDVVRGPNSGDYQDLASAVGGNGVTALVRLFEVSPGEWWEEALVPPEAYTISLAADVYDADTRTVAHDLRIAWQAPTDSPATDWTYPIQVPTQPTTPFDQLPLAVAPADPRNPPVRPGDRYRLYTATLVNTTGYQVLPDKTGVDLTATSPRPVPGPLLVHYMLRDGTVMDRS